MRIGELIIVLYWAIFTVRKHFAPKVLSGIKEAKFDVHQAKSEPEIKQHTRRLNLWTAAKWALQAIKWAENALVGTVLIWIVYVIGAVISGTIVVFGYPL